MKSNCAQKYLEIVVGGQFDIDEANFVAGETTPRFLQSTTERDGFPQLDKVGLGFTAELHGKVWSVPLVLRLVFIRITWATC